MEAANHGNLGVIHSHNSFMYYSRAHDMTDCHNIHDLLHGLFRESFLCSEQTKRKFHVT
jgi:hypothetical protein